MKHCKHKKSMYRKTAAGLGIAGLLAGTLAFAAPDSATVKERVDQLKSEFSLNDQQAARLNMMLSASNPEARAANREAMATRQMDRRLERMKSRLNLSDEQVGKLKTLMTEQAAKMEALRQENQSQFEAILTPEQASKLKAMRTTMQEWGMKGRGMRDGKRGGHGMQGSRHGMKGHGRGYDKGGMGRGHGYGYWGNPASKNMQPPAAPAAPEAPAAPAAAPDASQQ